MSLDLKTALELLFLNKFITDVTQTGAAHLNICRLLNKIGFKVQRTVTINERYFGATHLAKRYLAVATNIKVRCTSA